ncbi:NAD(P)-dependent oxidoreductase [Sulfurospirillum sp.]|uniref:NAD(P)-dependent oxidoreductase n=1 Tax=Sulfurospirillum sp. TaxID=2053622 RepID=UPI002FDE6E44
MKVAILGTGLMGTAMAEAVMKAGHEVIVYNRTAAKTAPLVELGAKAVLSPAEAILEADATIIVLLDGKGVKELLLDDALTLAFKGKKFINASTTMLDEIMDVADQITKHGGVLAEMTINADNTMLRSGEASFAIGCKDADEKFWTDLLLSFGKEVIRVGDIGDATKAEAASVFGAVMNMVTLAYSTAIAQKLNVKQEIYEPLVSMLVPGAEYQLANMVTHNHENIFAALDSYTAGFTIAIKTARSVGMPTEVLEEMLKLFTLAESRGFAKKDGSSVIEVLL